LTDADLETVPGEFDADDMIVIDGASVDHTENDDVSIKHHYMVAE